MLPVSTLRPFAVAAVLPWIVACGGADEPPLGETRSAIYQGQASGREDDAVVRLTTVNGAGSQLPCTGTLVAANLVVTARHCVANVSPGPFECDTTGELITIGDPGHVGTSLPPESINVSLGEAGDVSVATGTQVLTTDAPSICRDDIAYVVLDHELEAPICAVRVFDPVKPSELVNVVGYGTGSGDTTRHRLSDLPVLSVGPDQVDPNDTSLTPPRSFALGRSVCLGDSGAPALAKKSRAVLGVSSFATGQTGQCDSPDIRNFFVQVRTQPELLRAAFEAAGQKPWYEGGTKPGTAPPTDSGGCQVRRRNAHGIGASVLIFAVGLLLGRRERAGARSSSKRAHVTS